MNRLCIPTLTYNEYVFCGEGVFRDLQIERGGAFPDPARGVVMGAVAGAVVAAVLSSVSDGYAAQMGAHSDEDQPLVFLHALLVVLGVAQGCDVDGDLCVDLLLCPVPDKEGLSSPLEGHVLTLWDFFQLDFNLGHG